MKEYKMSLYYEIIKITADRHGNEVVSLLWQGGAVIVSAKLK